MRNDTKYTSEFSCKERHLHVGQVLVLVLYKVNGSEFCFQSAVRAVPKGMFHAQDWDGGRQGDIVRDEG
jgi:hypothetical protein